MAELPMWVTQSPFVQESRATISDLPEDIQAVIVHPHANPYELLKALSFLLYYVVPSSFLSFMTDVDADQCLEGIDGLFLLQDVKDFQAMMQLAESKRMLHSAKQGKLEWLTYLRQTGHLWDTNTSAAAAAGGHLACLQYLHDNNCPWDVMSCRAAAEHGHLACLQYLHANGCPWDAFVCSEAAEHGHLACLQYLHDNNCPWDVMACRAAAQHGHLACLQYLHDNNCPWDHAVTYLAALCDHMDCLVYALDNNCDVDHYGIWQGPAMRGNVDCMRMLVQRGVEMSNEACDFSAEAGNLTCLKFAFENGSEPYIALSEAAHNGHLPCLMYCHEQDFPDDACGLSEDYFGMDPPYIATDFDVVNALEAACYGDKLDCFKYLHEQGYSSGVNLCAFAAYSNSMDCLKYACEKIGHTLDFTVTLHGLTVDLVKCVEYVHLERGCPWNERILVEALMKGAYKSFKFAYENGCPVPPVVIPGSLPDWFASSRLVRECAPVPPETILRCLEQVHRDTILHPAPAPSAITKTLAFLEKLPIFREDEEEDEDEDEEMEDEDEDEDDDEEMDDEDEE